MSVTPLSFWGFPFEPSKDSDIAVAVPGTSGFPVAVSATAGAISEIGPKFAFARARVRQAFTIVIQRRGRSKTAARRHVLLLWGAAKGAKAVRKVEARSPGVLPALASSHRPPRGVERRGGL